MKTGTTTANTYASPWQAHFNRWIPPAVTVAMIIGTARTVALPLFQHLPWMPYQEDDFFYYLKIAQNLAHGAGSTFNGIVPTNGYHPLWLGVLALFSLCTTDSRLIFIFLAVCIFAATITTYFLARALLRISGAGAIMASVLGAYVAVYASHLFFGGMEVILAVPLSLAALLAAQHTEFWQRGMWQSACLGLLVSLMVLSRLDTILFAGLTFLCLVGHPAARRSISAKNIRGLALGLVPLVLYFLSNRIWFHTWLPISGMAKELKTNHLPARPAYETLLAKQPSQLISVALVVLAVLMLPLVYKRLSTMQQVLYPSALIFPFLYLFILSCVSDWPLWDWYFYSFRTGLCIALGVFCLWPPMAALLHQTVLGTLAALIIMAIIFKNSRNIVGDGWAIHEVAQDDLSFSISHPGTYAMGDRSGMVAYLLPQPLVQTEGPVMDRTFLAAIQNQVPLRTVLAQYGVRYYIATSRPPYATNCVHAVEPIQAGPASRHMTADFCEKPVAVFQQAEGRTSIFDLQQPSAKAPR